jgi:transposase-like protein
VKNKLRFGAAAGVFGVALLLAAGAVYATGITGGSGSSASDQKAASSGPNYDGVFSSASGSNTGRLGSSDGPNGAAVITRTSRQEVARAAAQVIGISERDLVRSYMAGQSITQIATDHGVTQQALRSGLLAYENNALAKAVSAGQISQRQSDVAARAFMVEIDRVLGLNAGANAKD